MPDDPYLDDPLRAARLAAAPLLAIGYREIGSRHDPEHFGNAYLDIERGDVRVRLVRERLEWIVGFGSVVDDDEWYGQHIVLRALGHSGWDTGNDDFSSFVQLCRWLAEHVQLWEPFFHAPSYPETRTRFEELGIEYWKELGLIQDR